MARTPESAAVDFAESSLFTGRFSILALAACGVGFSLSGRLPAAIFSLAAAAVAAAELGFATILMNRTPEKAQAIAETMPEYGFLPDPISDFKEAVKECDLVIYTLPMALPEIAEFTADDFAGEDSGQKKVILEANYKTPSFDDEARMKLTSADCTYISGRRWLLYQALTGYSIMTGLQPDLKAMSEVVF